jgi:hypothetical protein
MLGYDLMMANFSEYRIGNAHPVWSKIPVLVDAFRKYPQAKWVWWLDFDAIIMSPMTDLASYLLNSDALYSKIKKGEVYHLRGAERPGELFTAPDPDPNDIDLLITGDHNGLNAGSFFLRRGRWTDNLLDLWLDPFYMQSDWAGKEQDALIHMVEHHRFISDRVGILPQRALNAYSEGGEEMRWQPNDLVVHFAGCWYVILSCTLAYVGSTTFVPRDGPNFGR